MQYEAHPPEQLATNPRLATDVDWHGRPERPGGARYKSAEDAVDAYLRLLSSLEGVAIDYQEVYTSEGAGTKPGPGDARTTELVYLVGVFRDTCDRVAVDQWRVWTMIRRHRLSLREAATAESKKQRAEVRACPHLEALGEWEARYGHEVPDGADQPYRAAQDVAGISHDTARRYRDHVDSQVEQILVGDGAMGGPSVRTDAEMRDRHQRRHGDAA